MSSIEKFIGDIESQYGDYSVTAKHIKPLKYISTGSISLDVSIGIGGIPRGRYTEISGPESTGKTTVCLTIAGNCIKEGGRVLYIDAEHALDWVYIERVVGEVTDEQLVILTPKILEEAFTMAEAGIQSGLFDLIVFDSLPALSPEKERTNEFTDDTMGILARQTRKFLSRTGPYLMGETDIAFIFTNQVRANMQSFYGGYDTPAGYALRHWCAVRIALTKGRPIKDGSDKVGTNTKFVVHKNKVGIPYRSHTIPVVYGKGIDKELDVLDFASTLGIMKKRGSHFYFEGENIGQGYENASNTLRENPEKMNEIVTRCFELATGLKPNPEAFLEEIEEEEED